MELPDELVEILRRKGCAMSVARLADELKKAPQVIESNLGVLRRAGVVQILRPGEWELAPEKKSGPELIPPEPASAIACAPPRQPAPTTEETTMANLTKVCNECEKRKPVADFYANQAKCKPCYNARQATLKAKRTGKARAPERQGGVRKNGSNGATRFSGAIDLLKAEREQLAADLGKVDQAIAQLEALG
ncbi:MAG: hypothetical protein AB7O95_20955 [Geminicoccaceae bacterium]